MGVPAAYRIIGGFLLYPFVRAIPDSMMDFQ